MRIKIADLRQPTGPGGQHDEQPLIANGHETGIAEKATGSVEHANVIITAPPSGTGQTYIFRDGEIKSLD